MAYPMTAALRLAGLIFASALGLTAAAQAQSDAERLRALEALISAQQVQIEAQQELLAGMRAELERISAGLAATAAAAPPKTVASGNDATRLTVYGQINRGLLYYDDGNTDDIRHVDNDASSTRLGFRGSVAANEDLSVGALLEVQFESNSTAAINQADNTAVGPNNFTERKLEVFFASNRFGKLSIGQGDTASNSSSEADLSGTALAGYSAVNDFAGGLDFASSATGALSGITVGAVFTNLDGLSRDDRLRYDTPPLANFVLSSSFVDGGEWDVGLGYGSEFPGLKVAGKLGYANQSATRTFPETIVSGSLSALLRSGLNLTFAGGQADDSDSARDAIDFWYGKLGYIASIFPVGASHFSLDYGAYDNAAASGDEGRAYGVQFVQTIPPWGTELYAGYRNYSLDRAGASFDDISGVLTGVRVKF
jgi:predicted porin